MFTKVRVVSSLLNVFLFAMLVVFYPSLSSHGLYKILIMFTGITIFTEGISKILTTPETSISGILIAILGLTMVALSLIF